MTLRHGITIILLGAAHFCHAQTPPGNYPVKSVRVIVGSSPGGGIDIMARAVAQRLTERWGKPFVVDNRAGANGIIGIEMIAHAPPDGYTLFGGASLIVTATPMKKVPFDTRKVIAPVVQMTSVPVMLVTPPSLPANSVKEFIALARAKPGTLSYGTSGVGSIAHLGTELLKHMAGGIDLTHVPYKGTGQAFVDAMSGQIHLLYASGLGAVPHIRSGKLKFLAVTTLKRLQAFPDVPTVAETLPGYQLDNMHALYAPAGTPLPIVRAINREVVQYVNTPDMKERLALEATEAAPPNTPEEFRENFSRQVAMWERFIKSSGIKLGD
jgi:tripartite-type tricarboxylate transporter receptor subunit TctC